MAAGEEGTPLLPKQEETVKGEAVPEQSEAVGWTVDGLPIGHGNVMGSPVSRSQWNSSLLACLGRNDEFCSSDLEVCNVISLSLFLSPAPTFYKVWQWKSTRMFSGIPYVATLINCMLWVFYGIPIVHENSILVATINGTGVVLEVIYISMFISYCSKDARLMMVRMVAVVGLFFSAVVVLTLTLAHTHEKRSLIVGLLCVVFGTCMYASPLAVMRRVIRTKSVKYMPFYLSLASFSNGVIWTAYACIHFDIYVTIPNALGALLGAMQLILYAIYYRTTIWEDDEALNVDKIEDQTGSEQQTKASQADVEKNSIGRLHV